MNQFARDYANKARTIVVYILEAHAEDEARSACSCAVFFLFCLFLLFSDCWFLSWRVSCFLTHLLRFAVADWIQVQWQAVRESADDSRRTLHNCQSILQGLSARFKHSCAYSFWLCAHLAYLRQQVFVDPIDNPFDRAFASWPIRFFIVQNGRMQVVVNGSSVPGCNLFVVSNVAGSAEQRNV